MEEVENTSPRQARPNSIAFIAILVLVFFLPLIRIPWGAGFINADKQMIFVASVLVALVAWLIAMIKDKTFVIPKSFVLYSFGFVICAYLLSTIFSLVPLVSLSGSLFETDTSLLFLLLFACMFITSLSFQYMSRVGIFYLALFTSIFTLFIIQLTHVLFGWTFGDTFSYDTAILFGLGALISLIFIEFPLKSVFFRRISWFILAISTLAMFIMNFNLLWWIFCIFVVLVAILKINQKRFNSSVAHPWLSLFFVIISALALYFGGQDRPLANFTSSFLGANVEIRPSWQVTYQVAKKSLKENLILGSGPNLFSRVWSKHKPPEVNVSPFWARDFNLGVGIIPSSIVTLGVLGFLSWLFFLFALLRHTLIMTMRLVNEGGLLVYHYATAIGSLFLWLVAVVYIPELPLLILATIFTGVSISLNVMSGQIQNAIISTRFSSKLKYFAITVFVFVGLGIISVSYLYLQKYRALVYFGRGEFENATQLDNQSVYYRALAENYILVLLEKVNQIKDSKEAEKFQPEFISLLDRAVKAANRATELDPSDYLNWNILGDVYARATFLGVEGAYDHAKLAYESGMKSNPTNPMVYLKLAQLELEHKNTEVAVAHINKALALKPNYTEAYILASQIALSGGDVETAIRSIEFGVAADPNNFDLAFQLGYLYYQSHDYELAEMEFIRSLSLNPDYANAKYFLGLIYDEGGKHELAIKKFEEVLATNPSNQDVIRILANLRAGKPALTQ